MELSEDISSLACGHCFHHTCIYQQFEYRGTCPNCQKRACNKEIRNIHYNVVPNNKTNAHLSTLLAKLNVSERKQVEELLKEIKIEAEKTEKLRGQMVQNEKDLKRQGEHL
jgi:hypothetical protein